MTTTPADVARRTHRPQSLPDGTRPLVVDKPLVSLRPQIAKRRRFCEAWNFHTDAPAHCIRQIEPGRHYLLYIPVHPSTGIEGRERCYCAPCAVIDWAYRGVHEHLGKRL